MLPPIDDTLIQSNPNFALLYAKLTNTLLNPDASTKDDDTPAAKQRDAVRKELDKRRLKASKHHLLTQAIATATPPEPKPTSRSIKPQSRPQQPHQTQEPALPDPLIDLLLILPPILNPSSPNLSSSSLTLLLSSPPFSDLDHLLPQLSPIIASTLHTAALTLTRIAHPSTNPSYLHRQIPSLPTHILTTLITPQTTLQTTLSLTRLQTLSSLLNLLTSHASTLTSLIRLLELKHGIIARNLELQAATTAMHSQRTEIHAEQTLWTMRRDVYDKQAIQALRTYGAHLRDARVRTEERVRGLKAELGEYGVGVEGGEGKERVMREMARVYGQMGRQMQDTKGDLDRLRRG